MGYRGVGFLDLAIYTRTWNLMKYEVVYWGDIYSHPLVVITVLLSKLIKTLRQAKILNSCSLQPMFLFSFKSCLAFVFQTWGVKHVLIFAIHSLNDLLWVLTTIALFLIVLFINIPNWILFLAYTKQNYMKTSIFLLFEVLLQLFYYILVTVQQHYFILRNYYSYIMTDTSPVVYQQGSVVCKAE